MERNYKLSNLRVIRVNETEKWDEVVKSFKNYDVSYLCKYSEAYQLQGEGEALLLYYDSGETRAINVVMKRDVSNLEFLNGKIPTDTWFDISSPYGYGGILVEGVEHNKVNEIYNEFYNENGYISEFVRFNLFNEFKSHYSGCVETQIRNVVRTLDISIDDILKDFEHKVRKNLNKAMKYGLEVEIDSTGERLDEFLSIYYGTMKRTNANKKFFLSEEFFRTINEMSDNFVYIHILYDKKIISSELILYGPENCYSFLGGTDQEYFNMRPNDFLKFQIIKWAKEKGLKRFVLGGGYGFDDGIFRYKKSFAPNGVCDFYTGKNIINRERYDKLLKWSNQSNEDDGNFFPAYRR